jgi:hypothetical protein
VLAALMDCIEENGSPTRASMAGKQTMIDLLPLSRDRAGPVRRRGMRA